MNNLLVEFDREEELLEGKGSKGRQGGNLQEQKMNRACMWKIGLTLKAGGAGSARSFAAKAKKGAKGGAAGAPAAPTISKELKSSTTVGANILKEGVDPPVKPDSEYPDWLWHLLDKQPPLSELERKDPSTMSFPELQRFVKLDNRRRIKENNASRAKH